jgi:tRNA-modifying protein YgfZ
MTGSSYQSFQTSAGFYQHSPAGLLRIRGPHQVNFIQRQTTNDMQTLTQQRALFTILTAPNARLLDAFYLMHGAQEGEDSIDVISMTGNGRGMAAYLKSRIFFMDRVSVTDLSPDVVQISLGGRQAAEVMIKAGFSTPPQVNEYQAVSLDGVDICVLGQESQIGFPYRLIIASADCGRVKSALLRVGAVELSPDVFEILRVENGLPAAMHELVEAYTPLELNLETAISDTKGCYTGQEVIARQRTYDKVTRKLVGLRLEASVTNGAEVLAEGRPAGVVTTAVLSPSLGPIALAVLRRPHNEPNTHVQIKGEGQPVNGIVQGLPFPSQ